MQHITNTVTQSNELQLSTISQTIDDVVPYIHAQDHSVQTAAHWTMRCESQLS